MLVLLDVVPDKLFDKPCSLTCCQGAVLIIRPVADLEFRAAIAAHDGRHHGEVGRLGTRAAAHSLGASLRLGGTRSRLRYHRDSRPGRPPPRGLSVLGRASFTVSGRPPESRPFRAPMALAASASSVISTKPKPRERPVSRSVARVALSILPKGSNRERNSASVML